MTRTQLVNRAFRRWGPTTLFVLLLGWALSPYSVVYVRVANLGDHSQQVAVFAKGSQTTRKTIDPGDQSHFLLLTTETDDSDVLIDSRAGSQFCGYAGRLSSSQIVVIQNDDSATCSSGFGPTGIEL